MLSKYAAFAIAYGLYNMVIVYDQS